MHYKAVVMHLKKVKQSSSPQEVLSRAAQAGTRFTYPGGMEG